MSLLICPRDNWKNPVKVNQADITLLQTVASSLGLIFNHDKAQDKVYLDKDVRGVPAPTPEIDTSKKIYLPTTYYSQRDSQVVISGQNQARRTCFSSSMAMAVKAMNPGALSDSPNADDEYVRHLFSMGASTDTVNPYDQVACLKHFGIVGNYSQKMTWDMIDAELDHGFRVGIGWLCWGPLSNMVEGGHWSLIIGRTSDRKNYIVHDPFGEADLVSGTYVSSNGSARHYSRINLEKRWRPYGSLGWGMRFRKD